MNWDEISGNWKQFRGNIIERWGKLTEDDLDVAAGRRDQMVGKLQERYGLVKDEAERQVKAFLYPNLPGAPKPNKHSPRAPLRGARLPPGSSGSIELAGAPG